MAFNLFRLPTAGAEGLPKLEFLQNSTLDQSVFILQPYYLLPANPVGKPRRSSQMKHSSSQPPTELLINVGCLEQISTSALIKVALFVESLSGTIGVFLVLFFLTSLIYTCTSFILELGGSFSSVLWCEAASVLRASVCWPVVTDFSISPSARATRPGIQAVGKSAAVTAHRSI